MTTTQDQTNDSAAGSIAGTLFQFEKALLLLAGLKETSDFVTVEQVDDIATHRADGYVIATYQSKHSISASGTTFEDTSNALWRTMEIWINKLNAGILNENTVFTCCTNKTIPEHALVRFIIKNSSEDVIKKIEELLEKQETKLAKIREKKPTHGASMEPVINLIKFALSNKISFEKIKATLTIEEEKNVKSSFINEIHANAANISDLQRDSFYQQFYGWMLLNCKARWNNSKDAKFTKQAFDDKWHQINSNPAIVNAIFRTKELIKKEIITNNGTDPEIDSDKKRNELFVRQIVDIERIKEAKERAIKKAILDLIYCDIEVKHVVQKGDYTQPDFDAFLDQCKENWQQVFDSIVTQEPDRYNDERKNEMAIVIFDTVMNKIEMDFKEGFCFTSSSNYVKNGSFLKLSNRPEIGWHPEWEKKYKS